MLSTIAKEVIRECIAGEESWVGERGPVWAVDNIVDSCPREYPAELAVAENISANRDEAVRYAAGLLGMA